MVPEIIILQYVKAPDPESMEHLFMPSNVVKEKKN